MGIFACEEEQERTKYYSAKDDSQTKTLTWKGLGKAMVSVR